MAAVGLGVNAAASVTSTKGGESVGSKCGNDVVGAAVMWLEGLMNIPEDDCEIAAVTAPEAAPAKTAAATTRILVLMGRGEDGV